METANLLAWLTDPTRKIVAHLAQNFIPIDSDGFSPSSLTECTFPGYAPIQIENWNDAQSGDDALGSVDSDPLLWEAGVITSTQVIACVYLTVQEGSGSPVFWQAIPLPDPRIITDQGQQYDFTVHVDSADLTALQPVSTDV